MFNKSKDHSDAGERQAETPLTQSRKAASRSGAPSILSADLVVKGDIISDGEIQLDGQVDGDVRANTLIIGEKASVKGEVLADSVTVRGRVIGCVRGRQVQLASTARIEGDIIHSALSVETGAFFEGHCRHAADPLSAEHDQRNAAVSVAPAKPKESLSFEPKPATPVETRPVMAPSVSMETSAEPKAVKPLGSPFTGLPKPGNGGGSDSSN
jgi:cytoskeletal protein CcmA (bactofilin family)